MGVGRGSTRWGEGGVEGGAKRERRGEWVEGLLGRKMMMGEGRVRNYWLRGDRGERWMDRGPQIVVCESDVGVETCPSPAPSLSS